MIKLVSQNFFKELSAASVNWLLANVGDKIRIETTFTVETYAVSSLDDPFTLNHTDGLVGAGWVFDPKGQFKDFRVGDTIIWLNRDDSGTGTKTIIDKLDDYNIQVDSAFATGDNALYTNLVFSVTVPITAVKYHYNFIENNNNDSFLSAIDGSEQLLVHNDVDASDVTPLAMTFLGALTWQEGSATIQGVSIDSGSTDGVYKSTFKIIHYTKVTPWILISQFENEESDIPHIDFEALKCWKFISEIQAAYVYTDPNYIVSEIFSSVLGNSGWYGENFNTAKTNYYIDSISYKDSTGATITSAALTTSATDVTMVVKNTVDTPFSNNNTKFVLGFFKVPTVESEYLDVTKTSDENFLFDRKLQTVGSASANGDQYGVAGRQVLTNIVGTYNSTSQITITFKIEMLSAVVAALTASEDPQYILFLSIQNHTLATNVSDLVTLKAAMSEFYIANTDDTMISGSTIFLRHPEGDPDTEGFNPTGYTAELITNKDFQTDLSGWTNTYGDFSWVAIHEALGYEVENLNSFYQTLTGLTVGRTYGFSWTVINYISGNAVASIDSSTHITPCAANGSYVITFVATSTTHTVGFGSSSGVAYYSIQSTSCQGIVITPFECLPEDEIVSITKFYIDRTGRTTDDIVLTSVQNKIVVKNDVTLEEFELDGCTVFTSFYPEVGAVQYMDAQVARNFHIPAGTIRKYIELKRRIDLDGSNKYWFQLNFPFLFRWEYWVKLIGAHSDFFDNTEANNGFNHWWFHYFSGDWNIYNRVVVNATKNGDANQYIFEYPIEPHDYNSNTDWIVKTIKTYDPDDLTELYDSGSGKRFVLGYKNTLVKAVFEKNTLPGGVTVVIGLEVWEQGGYYGKRRYSSRWIADSDTWFSSTDGSGKVVLTPTANEIEAKCLIDFSQIPENASFKISARIYDGSFGLLTDDGVQITTDDGTYIVVD